MADPAAWRAYTGGYSVGVGIQAHERELLWRAMPAMQAAGHAYTWCGESRHVWYRSAKLVKQLLLALSSSTVKAEATLIKHLAKQLLPVDKEDKMTIVPFFFSYSFSHIGISSFPYLFLIRTPSPPSLFLALLQPTTAPSW